jgi:predicted RNA-binding protein
MCLSTVYAKSVTDANIMAKNVQKICFDGETIVLTDLMENDVRIDGRLRMVDLVNGVVIIDTEDII